MKKIFKHGLSMLIPLALVAWILSWIYNLFKNLTMKVLPQTMTFHWWYPIIVIIGIVIAIFIIGLIFKFIKPLQWVKEKLEQHIINKIPIIKTIYEFGNKLANGFLSDMQEGKSKVVKVNAYGCKMMGILTDEKNKVVFAPTGPNPTNGFIFVDADYEEVDMSSVEVIEFVTSLGKITNKKDTN